MQQKKNSIGPILFLYYDKSLVSSNLNSNLLRFHRAHPNVHSESKQPVLDFDDCKKHNLTVVMK